MAEWDYGFFWKETLNQILDEVGEQEFTRWFTLIEYLGARENEIHLGVPSAFYRDQIKQRYQEIINAKLQYIIGKPISLMLEIIARKRDALSPSPAQSPSPLPSAPVPPPPSQPPSSNKSPWGRTREEFEKAPGPRTVGPLP
ncbi:putative Chromosomal replication initiator protein DnaA [Hollandina sp. SP2]